MEFSRITNYFKTLKKSVFFKIFFFFLIPIAGMAIVAFSINFYYENSFKNEITDRFKKVLTTISSTLDSTLYEVMQTTHMLTIDKNLVDIIYFSTPISPEENYRFLSISDSLAKYGATKQLIDSVYLLHKGNNSVISSTGNFSYENFFDITYKYSAYDKNFWLSLTVPSIKGYRILNPSIVENTTFSQSRIVFPIAQSGLGYLRSQNLFVINISEERVSNILNQNKLTPNSNLFIINQHGTIFSHTDRGQILKTISDPTLLSKVTEKQDNLFIYEKGSMKFLIISHMPKGAYLEDFVYIAEIPLTDLFTRSNYIKTLVNIVLVVSIIISIFISFLASKRIYNPIYMLVNTLQQSFDISTETVSVKNEFEYLNHEIGSMIYKNKNLSQELSLALPIVCEQYLLKVLNSSEFILEHETKEFLSKNNINFGHQNFMVAVVNMNFTSEFYESFSKEEQLVIYKSMFELIKSIFPKNYTVFILSVEKDKLCVIINLPHDENEDAVLNCFRYMQSLFEYDSNFLQIFTGIGRIYSGFSGMHQSYKEALKVLPLLSPLSRERIKLYEKEKRECKYRYSVDEENKLFNYLMAGHKTETLALVNTIINKNVEASISESDMKELYIRLYNTGLRVLNTKNTSPSELMGNQYLDIATGDYHTPLNEIAQYIQTLFEQISNLNDRMNSKIDISAIIEYIENNYHKDIYLEQIASTYNTSANYLTRLLKEALGIPFQQHLANLRIAKAKMLLAQTKKPVNDIASEVGFNSRNTFIRMFKKMEGITPTDYRNLLRSR